MRPEHSLFWKKSPFIKLLLPLAAGILLQWYRPLQVHFWWAGLLLGGAGLALFFFIPLFDRYRYSFISGLFSILLFISTGALLLRQKDIRNNPEWIGRHYRVNDGLLVRLEEPPVEKPRSWKAVTRVRFLLQDGKKIPVKGRIICYFKKDSAFQLRFGSELLLKKTIQPILHSGNPGSFNYRRYCLFQGITHQLYLEPDDYRLVTGSKSRSFRAFLFDLRENLLEILRKNIRGEKELGLAEALLIGYKNDLDTSLVQAYARTGVVHIIAISGLHLGLIYWLLGLLLLPLKKNKRFRWLYPLLIITGLWLFSLLAGAQPSILRSALMFTCIVCAESLSRKTSVYNSLALSAFTLLCINPFWLWDIGFQLSYAAVLSILVFYRPVYNWFYIKNKILDSLWKLNAVTLAAQVLTLPFCVYHFHQFPNLFLLSNFLAVPLSSLVLLGEILLCTIAFIPGLALLAGKSIAWLIRFMNNYIEAIDRIPFSQWYGLQLSIPQALWLLAAITGFAYWLMTRFVKGLTGALFAFLCFSGLRSWSFYQCNQQEQLIIYQVPRGSALDIIKGRRYLFIGDSSLQADDATRNFHLQPARILFRVKEATQLPGLLRQGPCLQVGGRKILLLRQPLYSRLPGKRMAIDLLVVSGNYATEKTVLNRILQPDQVVLDGSVPFWRVQSWKKILDSLHIPCHAVSESGAFVMKLN